MYLFHIKKIKSCVNNVFFSVMNVPFILRFCMILEIVFLLEEALDGSQNFSFNLIFWALIFVKTTMACI